MSTLTTKLNNIAALFIANLKHDQLRALETFCDIISNMPANMQNDFVNKTWKTCEKDITTINNLGNITNILNNFLTSFSGAVAHTIDDKKEEKDADVAADLAVSVDADTNKEDTTPITVKDDTTKTEGATPITVKCDTTSKEGVTPTTKTEGVKYAAVVGTPTIGEDGKVTVKFDDTFKDCLKSMVSSIFSKSPSVSKLLNSVLSGNKAVPQETLKAATEIFGDPADAVPINKKIVIHDDCQHIRIDIIAWLRKFGNVFFGKCDGCDVKLPITDADSQDGDMLCNFCYINIGRMDMDEYRRTINSIAHHERTS